MIAAWTKAKQATPDARQREYQLERAVTAYIGAMPLVWLAVDDDPGPSSDRAVIEAGAIALLSNNLKPADPTSEGWLGRWAQRSAIRNSGLWNVRHVADSPSDTFLAVFAQHLERMEKST